MNESNGTELNIEATVEAVEVPRGRLLGVKLAHNGPCKTDDASRVPVQIINVLIDREQGASLVENIWEPQINTAFISNIIRARPELREMLAEFFLSNKLIAVFRDTVGSQTFRSGGLMLTKARYNDIVRAAVQDEQCAMLVTEITLPALAANGWVSNTFKYAIRRKVGYEAVTIEMIKADVMTQEIESAIQKSIKRFVVATGVTHATEAVAEEFSDVFRPVGASLLNISDYERIIDDMVTGVLANIDPATSAAQVGTVPTWLKINPVVLSMVGNWNFIRAAMELRSQVVGVNTANSGGVHIKSAEWMMSQFAGTIEIMIKNSPRFQLVSKREYISFIGTKKILGLDGVPRSTVLFDNARLEPAAMAVTAIRDAGMEGAVNLSDLPDRVSASVSASYGSLADVAKVSRAAELLADVLSISVEEFEGNEIDPLYQARFASSVATIDLMTVAAMVSDNVCARFDDATQDDDSSNDGYILRFSGKTQHPNLKLYSGAVVKGWYYTTDPVEALLAADEIEAQHEYPVPPQLIPKNAIRARLVGYSDDDFVKTTERMGYSADVLGMTVQGKIRLKELASIQAGDLTVMVRPFHNALVMEIVDATIGAAYDEAMRIENSIVRKVAIRNVGTYALRVCQSIAPNFRQEVQSAIIERTVDGKSRDKSWELRSRLRSQAFTTYADVLATQIFFKMQGLTEATSVLDALVRDPDIKQHWLEAGSDRA